MNEILEWDFHKYFNAYEDGEQWKREPKLLLTEALHKQSRTVYRIAKLFCETPEGEQAEFATEPDHGKCRRHSIKDYRYRKWI